VRSGTTVETFIEHGLDLALRALKP
jgi:hypothetical protein